MDWLNPDSVGPGEHGSLGTSSQDDDTPEWLVAQQQQEAYSAWESSPDNMTFEPDQWDDSEYDQLLSEMDSQVVDTPGNTSEGWADWIPSPPEEPETTEEWKRANWPDYEQMGTEVIVDPEALYDPEVDYSTDPAYVEGTREYHERITLEEQQLDWDTVDAELLAQRDTWDELSDKEKEIYIAQDQIDREYGVNSDIYVVDVIDGVPVLKDSRGVEFIETRGGDGVWRLEEKGSRTIGVPVGRPAQQAGKPAPYTFKRAWEEAGSVMIDTVGGTVLGPVYQAGKVGIALGKGVVSLGGTVIDEVSGAIDTAKSAAKWTAIVMAVLMILFIGTALYFGYKALNSGTSAVMSLATRADPNKLLNAGLMAFPATRAVGVGSELISQVRKDSRVIHDARCVCDACQTPDAFARDGQLVVADDFYVTPSTASSIVHLPEGEYGRTYLDERPFRIEISARATAERQRLALVHELLHVYDEVHKLGITHDQLHGLSYYILSEVMPGVAKLDEIVG